MRRSLIATAVVALLPLAAEAATFTVLNTNTSGPGSLAQAITDANATATADLIEFNIPGIGVKTIGGTLPPITQPLTIDGYSQPGASVNTKAGFQTDAVLLIELDGSGLDPGDSILDVESSTTFLQGLVLNSIPTKCTGISVATGLTNVRIRGCFIGTNAKANADDSSGNGIVCRGQCFIGSDIPQDLNVISGNNGDAIQLRGADSIVSRNLIGANLNGKGMLGNGRGVNILGAGATRNLIGGNLNRANLIVSSDAEGVRLAPDAGDGNTIQRNRIALNGGLGIDLGGDGPTPNDADDSDEGPNELQNTPELAFARINLDKLEVRGVLRGAPGPYIVFFYLNDDADPSGFGEGETHLSSGLQLEIPDGETEARFVYETTTPVVFTGSTLVAATAQRNEINASTSEFSRNVEARPFGNELVVTNTNDSGPGSLRAAVEAANATVAPDTVVFEIPGDGPHTITLASSLQIEGGPLLIDGCTQQGASPNTLVEGSNAVPGIRLDGNGGSPTGVVTAIGTSVVLRCLAVYGGSATSIRLLDTVDAVVEGCFVGTDGDAVPGSGQHGIEINGTGTLVGGPDVGRRNVVVASDNVGILDRGTGTRIENNIVGRDLDGTSARPNLLQAIQVGTGPSVIGGDEPAFENLIGSNGGAGVRVLATASGVEIRGNRIEGNNGLGIDLLPASNATGVTPNDAGDADDGGNALQNYPDDVEATIPDEGFLGVSGTLDVPDARIGTEYTIRVFASDTCDGSGHGEGSRFLGVFDTVIPANEQFSTKLDAFVESGEQITLTATDPVTGNTSEFSACATASIGEEPLCGDANSDGKLLSGDALIALKAAVGTAVCDLCRCDANDSGAILAGDAQQILKKAVGQPAVLACPVCD